MPEPSEPDEEWRTTVNLLGAIVILIVVCAGGWLVLELDKARKAQACLSSTRADCRRIQAP